MGLARDRPARDAAMKFEPPMRQRRDFLKLAVGGALAGMSPAGAGAVEAVVAPAPAPFSADQVVAMARELAKTPFKAPKNTLPDPFANLTYDQYVAIRSRPGSALWTQDNVGFALEPLHRGFIFSTPMDINVIENGAARRIAYDRNAFDFGKLQLPDSVPDIGFSGFRVLSAVEGQGLQEVAIYQGASFFRAKGRGQTLGVTARGLSIHTGDPQGEEFPLFRSMWVEKPTLASNALVIHALLDSASATGAYRFTLRPGETTIIDTELTLFARTPVDHIGLGAMSGIYLFGDLDHPKVDDVRPNVYEINGLQMLTGKGEWIWRPVANRETLQISAFVDQNPHGFGLLQRSRSFYNFQDDDQHWELRPSLWIEPIGDWGEGQVQLLEIPTESENNANIIAQWRPKAGLAEGATQSFAYRQFWCWAPPSRSPLATCTGVRMGKVGKNVRFVVEFSSDIFGDPVRSAEIKANITARPGKIAWSRSIASSERKSMRIAFDLDPGSEMFSELRLALDASGQPASETWLYRWTA
jgi:periplasmic glucans biosynthesis protein